MLVSNVEQSGATYRPLIWWALGLLALFSLAASTLAGFRIEWDGIGTVAFMVMVTATLVHLSRSVAQPIVIRVIDTLEIIAIFSALAMLACVASYPIAALAMPLADPLLAKMDGLLGFSWVNAYRLVASSPTLHMLSIASYKLIFTLPLFVLIYLGLSGHGAMARRFTFAYMIAVFIALGFFVFFPAVDPVEYYGVDTAGYLPLTGRQAEILHSIRNGDLRVIRFAALEGMVSFPSVHAASAVLFTWAVRHNRAVVALVGLLSAMMFVATLVEGNHYLVDLLAGILLGIVAIKLSDVRYWRFFSRRPPAPLCAAT